MPQTDHVLLVFFLLLFSQDSDTFIKLYFITRVFNQKSQNVLCSFPSLLHYTITAHGKQALYLKILCY